MISRRRFLYGAGIGAATVGLAGCRDRGSGSPAAGSSTASASSVPPTPTPTPTPSGPSTLAQLRARLPGRLLEPGDAGYAQAKLAYNPLFDAHAPAAVARCASPADVQACVEFAAASGTPIAARSGGHSYAGYSTPDHGLVVDLSGFDSVAVQADGTAVVGAGTRLINLYSALAAAGRALPGGSCPTVGIAGLTLGGGIGLLARKFGLTCDRLVSAQVVTADGVLRTASATSEPDLYWALRGGGGGNVGVVTSFSYATVPAPAVTVFSLPFPNGSAVAVLGAWQDWIGTAPPELFANCIVQGTTVSIGGCFVGPVSGLSPLVADLTRRTGTASTSPYVAAMTYLDAMRYFASCSNLSATQCEPAWTSPGGQLQREAFVASSRIIETPMSDPQAVVSAISGAGLAAIFDSLGSAVSTVAASATAFPHRGAVGSVQLYQGTSASGAAGATATVDQVRDALTPLLGQHGYVNYIDPSMPGWGQAYYGANLARLQKVARTYDPSGVFSFAQNVAKA